jgi:hypothetical protein
MSDLSRFLLFAHRLAHIVGKHPGGRVVQGRRDHRPTHEHARSPTANVGGRTNSLRAKSAEVQGKLQAFASIKEWRDQFPADIEEKLRRNHELFKELGDLNREWQESKDHWYVFEHESNLWIGKRLDEQWRKLAEDYWATKRASDDEKKYVTQSQKTEVRLLNEQRAIIVAISTLDKGAPQSQVDSLMARLNRLSDDVDRMWDEEIRAHIKFGVFRVSRAK